MAKTRLVGKAWQEASAVFGGAVGVALVDPSFAKLIAVAAFAVVYAATVVLFAQLQEASELPGTEVPAWLDTSVLVIVGAGGALDHVYGRHSGGPRHAARSPGGIHTHRLAPAVAGTPDL